MKKQMFAVVAALLAASVWAGTRVGFARVDITPPCGVFMPGYYVDRRVKEVLDPLAINMVAFSDGVRTALVAQVDTEALSDLVADRMRDAIVKATGVDRDAILLHASHTHDGGHLAYGQKSGASSVGRGEDAVGKLYVDMSVSRAADAAVMAVRDLRPARLSCGRGTARRIAFGRRYLMKSGKVQTNPGTNNPDIVRPVGNPPDEQVQVLRVDRDGAKGLCLVNFQCHPDVVGGETATADWPGLARGVFEAATFGEAHCVVFNGAEGDLNHCNVMPRPGELNGLTRDFDAVDRGYDHARHMANVVAGAALSVWMKCAPLEGGEVRFGVENVRVPAQKAKASDEKNLAWAEEIWALHQAGKDAEISKRYGYYAMELTTELARARRIRNMAGHGDFHDVPLMTVSIGRSVAFCGFPGEPFNDIGKQIKEKSPFGLSFVLCLTNGSRGYFPFSDSFREGGYEAATSPFGPSVADDLIAGELSLLRRLCK